MADVARHADLTARLVYPAGLALFTAGAWTAIESGIAPGVVVSVASLALIPLCHSLERARPETAHWTLDRGEFLADLLHMLVSNPIPMWILRAALQGGLVVLSGMAAERLGFGLWPTEAPLVIQACYALLVAEFVNYWVHRSLHRSRLWPLHAVHHCSHRMYFFLSVRKHPLQSFVTYGARLGALWFLGVTEEAFALYSVWVSTNSYLQHANVRMETGALSRWLATPEVHRVHHSNRPDELDANYGDSVVVWDRLFGTYIPPASVAPLHESIGLPGLRVPQTYASHLGLPFRWAALQRQRADAPAEPPRQ